MNYYDILNVDKNATKKEIKSSYKILVKKYHPDVYTGDKSFAEKKIKEINSAYDILSDDKLRKEYDASLSGGYEFDESAVYDEEPVRYTKKESYEDFYKSTNNDIDPETFNPKSNDLENDVYENYKKVYNDFVNKNSKTSSYTYTGAKENYTDYYRASAYRKPSYSSNPNPEKAETVIEKKIYASSKTYLFFIFILFYLIITILLLSDLKTLSNPKDNSDDTHTNYVDDSYVAYPDYYENTIKNNSTSNTDYEPYYIIGDYQYSLSELRSCYNEYYTDVFSTFDDFMAFIIELQNQL